MTGIKGVPGGLSGYLITTSRNDEKEKKNNWCGKHKPVLIACPIHKVAQEEMHLEGHGALAGLVAIFYCPVLSCTEVEPIWEYDDIQISLSLTDLALKFGFPMRVEYELLAETVIYNALRMQVLAHKLGQREGDGK